MDSRDRILQRHLKHSEIKPLTLSGEGASAGPLTLLPLPSDFVARLEKLEAAMVSVSLLVPLSQADLLKKLGGPSSRKRRVLARRLDHFSAHIADRRGK